MTRGLRWLDRAWRTLTGLNSSQDHTSGNQDYMDGYQQGYLDAQRGRAYRINLLVSRVRVPLARTTSAQSHSEASR